MRRLVLAGLLLAACGGGVERTEIGREVGPGVQEAECSVTDVEVLCVHMGTVDPTCLDPAAAPTDPSFARECTFPEDDGKFYFEPCQRGLFVAHVTDSCGGDYLTDGDFTAGAEP